MAAFPVMTGSGKSIAFVCHPYHRGGVTRWMADAAIYLANKGYKVWFVTVAPSKPFVSAGNRETMVQLLAKAGKPINLLTAAVAHEFEFGTPQYRVFIYKRLIAGVPAGTPLILSDDSAVWEAATALHQHYPIVPVLHADEDKYYDLAARYHQQSNLLVCVSARVHKKVLAAVHGLDAKKVVTIPCGINLPPVTAEDHHDVLQLAYSGRLSVYQKRVFDLVPLCTALVKHLPFHLNIMGEGESKGELMQQFADAGLAEHITFHGWRTQQEVQEILAATDALLLTSDFEGMPIAMMEALASGCGFVGTRVSGIEDYELHPLAAQCFRVFTTGDTADAARKIAEVAAVPVPARRRAARKLAEAEFSMEVCMDRYLAAIAGIPSLNYIQPVVPGLSLKNEYISKALATARYLKVRKRP